MPPLPVLLPSVVDRLMDPGSMGAVTRGAPIEAVTEAVRRDVEDLLNSRRIVDPELDRFPELSKSVFAYGVPEFVSKQAVTPQEREEVGRQMADAIARNEPRLRDVRARLLTPTGSNERSLRFLITARLRLDPAPAVEFETVVRLSTGQTAVVKPTGG